MSFPCVLISDYPLHYDVPVSESTEVMSQHKPLILQIASVGYFVPEMGKLTNTLKFFSSRNLISIQHDFKQLSDKSKHCTKSYGMLVIIFLYVDT